MNRRPVLIAALAVVVATGVALSAGVLVAQAGDDTLDAATIVGVLDDRRAEHDVLPATLDLAQHGHGGLVGSSSRLLGADGTRSFWVAQDAADDICLVVALGDAGQTIATACNRPERVKANGLVIGFQGGAGTTASVAYLLPDAAVVDTLGAPWRVVSDNVIVAAADELEGTGVTLPTEDDTTIVLVP